MNNDISKAETERIIRPFSTEEDREQDKALIARVVSGLDDHMDGLEKSEPTIEIRHVYESRLFHWSLVLAGLALGALTMYYCGRFL